MLWRKEIPNILCFYRIAVSIFIMLAMPKGTIFGVLYSTALISDLLDGYIYRRAVEHPNHWFNRLPISMDPIADFIYGISGLIIGVRLGIVHGVFIVITVVACISSNILLKKVSGIIWQIIANFLTYGFFAVMVLSDFIVWKMAIDNSWPKGFIPTMVVFYIIYIIVHDESHTIRKEG